MAVHEQEHKARRPRPRDGDRRIGPTGSARSRVWRYLLAALLALHGLVHVAGFAAAWQPGGLQGVSATSSFSGLQAGTPAALFLGVLWLVAGAGFVAGGGLLALRRHWWSTVTACTAVLSLALCVMWWQSAAVGIAADAVVLGFLVLLASPLGRPAEGER